MLEGSDSSRVRALMKVLCHIIQKYPRENDHHILLGLRPPSALASIRLHTT